MRRLSILAVCVFVLLAGPALAQAGDSKLGLGVNLSYMGLSDTGEGDNISFDGTPLLGANLTNYFNRFFSIELAVGYSKVDADWSDVAETMTIGELEQFPVYLSARLHLPLGGMSPYAGLGVGYVFNEFTTSEVLGEVLDTDNSFAYHLNAGLELFLGEHLALSVDAKYIWSEADGELTVDNVTSKEDLDLNNVVAGASLKLYF